MARVKLYFVFAVSRYATTFRVYYLRGEKTRIQKEWKAEGLEAIPGWC